MGHKKKSKRRKIDTPRKQKMSEIIWEYAGYFISMGDTSQDKESRLNAACSVWNIACSLPEAREKGLDHYMREYRRFNPDTDEEQLVDIRKDVEKLFDRKLEMFPDDFRQIVGARICKLGDEDRLEIMSARTG